VSERSNKRIERTDEGIEVTITAEFGNSVKGWEEAREDLGLNKHGDPVAGVELVTETAHYHDEGDEYPYGYGPVTIRVPDVDALEEIRSHLYDQATERFEWGADGDVVQHFAGRLPGAYEVENVA